MKREAQIEARRLRSKEGMSIKAIAVKLGVSKSSVSGWVRDIALTKEQRLRLDKGSHRMAAQRAATEARSKKERTARMKAQEDGRRLAREDDPLHRSGCLLYWAEGSKRRNGVVFANSDPHMLRFFVDFLRRSCGASSDRIAITINCYLNNGLTIEEIHQYWLDLLDLPAASLRKPSINKAPKSSKRKGRTLLYGTVHVVVNDTSLVQSIYGAIQEYGGFDEPAWLDCAPAPVAKAA